MTRESIILGKSVCHTATEPVQSEFVMVGGSPYMCVRNVNQLPPFLMSVVSDSDPWLFVGSNTPFTAGRVNADHALFPYQTVDKIMRSPDTGGALSVLLVKRGNHWALWEPWQASGRLYRISRHLYKHAYGTTVIFEEINHDLGLCFRWSLTTCERYGFVRECSLENLGKKPVEVRYLDGWHQILTPNVRQETFSRFSYLSVAYMRHDSLPEQALGIYALNAGTSDRAEPCESLRAACAWSIGHAHPTVLLCDRQLEAFRRGDSLKPEREVRGEMGAYLVADHVKLAPKHPHTWFTVADTGLDHSAVIRLRDELKKPKQLEQSLRASIRANEDGLRRRIAAADGLQQTADRTASIHHFANVLFNCMRGGTLNDSYRFPGQDFAAFVRTHNKSVFTRHRGWLEKLPESLTLDALHEKVGKRKDVQLSRLAHEYLPLTFSRRHGDPSRPWNWFDIHVKDDRGNPVFSYQGNWRDIFQNWESLGQSYPALLEQMITVFLNASTADGYNPYRITRDGIDWEVHNPKNPDSYIGYWGDHQIIYLLRLLESYDRFYPGRLAEKLRPDAYAYALVPYEIVGFDSIVANPRNTVNFNHPLHEQLMARAKELGPDGKLLADDRGEVVLVSLAEKLLVPLLAKLSNFVPEGGIWLNTQRPEWNDANNALAGWGLSMVTVNYLRRYLVFCDRIFALSKGKTVSLSASVAVLLEQVTGILRDAPNRHDDASRFRMLADLGRAGETYRAAVYKHDLGKRTTVPLKALRALIAAALPVIEKTIRASRRSDGLYHSYNVLHIADGQSRPKSTGRRATVAHLYPMLEGQVAVLSSGMLKPKEAVTVLQALRKSDLYRADQRSYVLYPDRVLPTFLERNALKGRPPIEDHSLFVADDHGRWHFNSDLRNAMDVSQRLDQLGVDEGTRKAVLDLWENTFRHSEFTGRSGTFFAFEGLGSIYWHMIAKLLLATQESYGQTTDPRIAQKLAGLYDSVRDGLGFRKTPVVYGAFPTDPYSHTPRHRGAQQPGMTGQVKEEILTRWGELGIEIEKGCLRFAPRLLHRAEFFTSGHPFEYVDVQGKDQMWDMPAESLGFTYCQVPVCYQLAPTPMPAKTAIVIERANGRTETVRSNTLSPSVSASIFGRCGEIRRLTVLVSRDSLPAPTLGSGPARRGGQ